MRLGFKHIYESKLRHGLKKTSNQLCYCSMEAETTTLIMCCHFYNSNQTTLTIDRENIPISFSIVSDNNLISLVLFARDKFDDTKNEKKKWFTEVWWVTFLIIFKHVTHTLSFLLVNLPKVFFYPFKELVLYVILL